MDSRKDINISTGRLTEQNLAIAATVRTIAQEMSCTSAQVALAWTLLNPAVTSTILGVRTLEQLKDDLGALDITLNADQIARLDV